MLLNQKRWTDCCALLRKFQKLLDYLVKHAQVQVDVHAISYATRQTSYRTLSSWCFTGSGNVGVIYGCGDSLVDCSGMWAGQRIFRGN